MRAAASVTPIAFSQKLSSKGTQPPDAIEPLTAWDDATKGLVIGETDHRDEKGPFVDASGTYLTSSDAVPSVATPSAPDGAKIKKFRTTLNLLGDSLVETTPGETLEQVVRLQADRSGGYIAGQVIRVPLLEAWGQNRVRTSSKKQTNRLISLSAGVAPRGWGLLRPETPHSWKEIIG